MGTKLKEINTLSFIGNVGPKTADEYIERAKRAGQRVS